MKFPYEIKSSGQDRTAAEGKFVAEATRRRRRILQSRILSYIEIKDSKYSSQHPYRSSKPYVILSAVHNNSFDQNPFYRYKA